MRSNKTLNVHSNPVHNSQKMEKPERPSTGYINTMW